MSGDQSSDSERNGPPPIPTHPTPPPIPHERVGSSHTPPPVPVRRPAIVTEMAPLTDPPSIPLTRPSAGLPDVPRRSIYDAPVNVVVSAPIHHEPVMLSRVALLLTLLCIPLAFLGSFWPLLRSPFWLSSLVLALIALALTKFTINNSSGTPTALSKLTLQLSHGFILISIIGLIAAAFRASLFLSGTVDRVAAAIRAAAKAQQGTNDMLAWVFHKIDVIVSYFGSHHAADALPGASPSPSPPP